MNADRPRRLFPDTKAAEYLAEQVLAGEFTGDLAQGVLREPQILREQLESARAAQGVCGVLHMLSRAAQRIEMPAPGGERPGVGLEVSGAQLQVSTQ
jgi:hypothetical protein